VQVRGYFLAPKRANFYWSPQGTATLHLPDASRRRFMVDESPEDTFCLVPLVNEEELPAELRDRMAANEADPGRLVRHPRHRG